MITDRSEVTSMIRAAKVQKNISWTGVATAIGQSKEWTTAGCLGQMAFNRAQAEKIGAIFGLSDEAVVWLQIAPYKGSLPTAVPTDPLIYRWYEIVAVYGTTIKELIHEEFGDGIMSAIDFSMDISREADPKGDRVKVIIVRHISALQNLLSERRAPRPLSARHARWVARPGISSKPTRKRIATFVAAHLEGQ